MDQCSIGKALQQKCDEEIYVKDHKRIKFEDLDSEQQLCLTQRTGLIPISDVCSHHHEKYFFYYSNWQKNCCNPLNDHKRKVVKGRRLITTDMAKKYNLVPGTIN